MDHSKKTKAQLIEELVQLQKKIESLSSTSELALQQSTQLYQSIYETTIALADKTDLVDIIATIGEKTVDLLNAEYSTFYLWDEQKNLLVPHFTNAKEDQEEILAFNINLGEGITGHAAKDQKGTIENYSESSSKAVYIPKTNEDKDNLQSIIAEPMLDGNKLIGVINAIAYELLRTLLCVCCLYY